MDIAELNARFGAPGKIVFCNGFAGYPNVVIANKYGAARIALLGATVLSYRPTGHSEVLFRPSKDDSQYNRADSFHGGIPVCWPQFGNRFSRDLPQHGFARKMVFEVRGTEYTEEITEVTLAVKSNDETMKLWPHEFDLECKISVSMKLNLALRTRNTGASAFDFSCAFHPYFRLRDRNQSYVRGLDALSYVDGLSGKGDCVQCGDYLLDRAVDDIFSLPALPRHDAAIIDKSLGRAIATVSTGCRKTVVWNPGENVPADQDPEDWRKFICVEPVSEWPGGQTLSPGEEYVLATAIQVSLDERKK